MSDNNSYIYAIPALKDNYIWSIQTEKGMIIVDPGESQPVLDFLEKQKTKCFAILITHHHFDHVGGVDALYEHNDEIIIYGPENLPITSPVKQTKSSLIVEGIRFETIKVPGHTLDHISYYDGKHLFIGDTLFSAGCGRVFEGTHKQMLQSLDSICELPDTTIIYCAHEYTLNNLFFAKFVEPDNKYIDEHIEYVNQCSISLPTTLKKEKLINPFLRLDQPTIHNTLINKGITLSSRLDVFSALRNLKDDF